MKVLIVDDDGSIVDGLTELLRLADIDIADACDRLSAHALMSAHPPGFIGPMPVRAKTKMQSLLSTSPRALAPIANDWSH